MFEAMAMGVWVVTIDDLRWEEVFGSLKKQIRVANLRNHFGYEHLPSQPRIISLLGKIAWIVPLLNDGMIKRLGARLPNYIPGGKILDIGCGNGSYLAPTLTSLQ